MTQDCNQCRGTGHSRFGRNGRCRVCKGTGKVRGIANAPPPVVDPAKLAIAAAPRPDERAVLMLAVALNDAGPQKAAVPWDLQEQAAKFYNDHGLARTLDEIARLAGPEALEGS